MSPHLKSIGSIFLTIERNQFAKIAINLISDVGLNFEIRGLHGKPRCF